MVVTIISGSVTDNSITVQWQTNQQASSTANLYVAVNQADLTDPAKRFTVDASDLLPGANFLKTISNLILADNLYWIQCEADGNLSAVQSLGHYKFMKRTTDIYQMALSNASAYLNRLQQYCQSVQNNITVPAWVQIRLNKIARIKIKLGL